jgi:hypothetical protein
MVNIQNDEAGHRCKNGVCSGNSFGSDFNLDVPRKQMKSFSEMNECVFLKTAPTLSFSSIEFTKKSDLLANHLKMRNVRHEHITTRPLESGNPSRANSNSVGMFLSMI